MKSSYPIFRFEVLLVAACLAVFGLIVLGGMLRLADAGGACQDWPACLGRWTPPQAGDARLDYLHRAASLLAGALVLAALAAARRSTPVVRRALAAAAATLVVQVALGAVLAQSGDAGLTAALHLGLSLVVLAALVFAALRAFFPASVALQRDGFTRLAGGMLALLFLLFASGALVAARGSAAACQGWPLCTGPLDGDGWLNLIHRGVVLTSAIGMLILVRQAWATRRDHTPSIVLASAAAVLFFAQALLGARLAPDFPVHLLVIHQATAAAVWAALAGLVAVAPLAPVPAPLLGQADRVSPRIRQAVLHSPVSTGENGGTEGGISAQKAHGAYSPWLRAAALLKDLLMLTKPVVVLLLLVTTYAGMVIGAKAWPSPALALWTLLGGFMAAGGSGAINQYIDRDDDVRMQRTQKRPIPAGRLTPGEGLAFGVAMALGSFYVMLAFTNLLAALLSLAGIFYYVVLYSLMLKKTTVQNIVIGGGAGAIPPLVGWAAATGGLDIPSLFLFAVVFMWTPPHFWALALVRRNDYARAGVPMLPVIRGEAETRRQILIYTLELVALTLFLPLFGLGGSIYLVGAGVLGLWLLAAAWKVWKQGGNKLAWKMYRYSSMYLAFLFVVLMVDALL